MVDDKTRHLASNIQDYLNDVSGGNKRPVSDEALGHLRSFLSAVRTEEKPGPPSPGQKAARSAMGTEEVAAAFKG